MAAVRHLEFLKFNFVTSDRLRDPFRISVPDFEKIGKPLRRYRDFCDFQHGAAAMLDFQKIVILRTIPCRGPIYVTAKFHQNRLYGCRDMAILRFSEWQMSAILDL